jgi:hypothetical protein
MQFDFWLLIALFVFVDLVVLYFVLTARKKRGLSTKDRAFFEARIKLWRRINCLIS